MKIELKALIVFIIALLFVVQPQTSIYAADDGGGSISSMVKATNPAESDGTAAIGSEMASEVIKKVLAFLQLASALIAVVVIALTGFKYVFDNDVEVKNEMKKRMLPIVIGMILVFSATTVAKFLLGVVRA